MFIKILIIDFQIFNSHSFCQHQTKEACAVYITSYLKVVGYPKKKCNNSNTLYSVKPLYNLSFFGLKISYVFKYKEA